MMGAEIDEKAVLTYVSSLYRALPSVPPQTRLQSEQVCESMLTHLTSLSVHNHGIFNQILHNAMPPLIFTGFWKLGQSSGRECMLHVKPIMKN